MNSPAGPTVVETKLKDRLLELAKGYLAVSADDSQAAERRARLSPLFDGLSRNVFRLVIMGEVKKGKSSFINALLGKPDLLPIATDIATSTVYKIVYGPERYTVFFAPQEDESGNRTEAPPLQITHEQLHEYGTEDGNPGNCKQVDFIAIELEHPLLAEGIVIVDTPGVGGLFKQHRDITFRYAPQADTVLFVLDSVDAVISEDEVQFLRELQQNTQHIVFLQTKIDIAGTEQIEAWKKRNIEILTNVLKVDRSRIPYFLVGAKLKQRADKLRNAECLQESGYLAVLDYIRQRLIPARDSILTRRWLPSFASELLATAKLANDRLAIARQALQPRMAEYESQLLAAEAEFEQWQCEVWPDRYRNFQDEVSRLKREARNRLQDELSPESRVCLASLEELREKCKTVNDVNTAADEFLSTWAARWSENATAILGSLRNQYIDRFRHLVGNIAEDLRGISLPEIEVETAEHREKDSDSLSAVREAAMHSNIFGGMAGEATGYLAFGLGLATKVGLLTTPVGLALTAAAGVGWLVTRIWSASRGYRTATDRQREMALANLERTLIKTGATATRGALRIFEEVVTELDANSRARTDAFRMQTKKQFTVRRQEIMQAKSRTAAESRAADESLKGMVKSYQELIVQLQALNEHLDPAGSTA